MNKLKQYIKPQTDEILLDARSGSLLGASGVSNVSKMSLTSDNIDGFTFEGKENNDDDWDEE